MYVEYNSNVYGYLLLCVDMIGCAWLRVVKNGYVWLSMSTFGNKIL